MRAAFLEQVNEPLIIEDVTASEPGPHDVVVRLSASGVCHSDLSVMNGTLPMPPPVIMGHEGAGIVEEVGREVTRVKKGAHVIASFIPSCGYCFFCLNSQPELCDQSIPAMLKARATRSDGSELYGMAGLGTFGEVMSVSEQSVVPIDSDLPPEQLALIGCGVTTGVGAALNTAEVRAGSTVVVVGCGGVGQSVIQGARIAGAAEIFAVDPVELKRKTGEKMGATHGIDPSAGDPVAQVQALTGGRGADYVFEAIGRKATIEQAWRMTRSGGTCIVIGASSPGDILEISALEVVTAEKTLKGCMYGSAHVHRDFPRLVKLAENGRLDLDAMVSRKISLDEINDAFRAMEAGEVIRSVVMFP